MSPGPVTPCSSHGPRISTPRRPEPLRSALHHSEPRRSTPRRPGRAAWSHELRRPAARGWDVALPAGPAELPDHDDRGRGHAGHDERAGLRTVEAAELDLDHLPARDGEFPEERPPRTGGGRRGDRDLQKERVLVNVEQHPIEDPPIRAQRLLDPHRLDRRETGPDLHAGWRRFHRDRSVRVATGQQKDRETIDREIYDSRDRAHDLLLG